MLFYKLIPFSKIQTKHNFIVVILYKRKIEYQAADFNKIKSTIEPRSFGELLKRKKTVDKKKVSYPNSKFQ